MEIIKASPRVESMQGRSRAGELRVGRYSALFDLLTANPGEWFAVNPSEVAGKDAKIKATVLSSCARHRGMKLQTTHQDDLLYVRAVHPAVSL
jgi:hypothetical protein